MPHLGDYDYLYQPGSNQTTLLLLHGTGGDEHDLMPIAQSLDPAANILSLRGNVNEHGQLRFFKRLAEGVYDLDDLKVKTEQLADFMTLASEQHHLDLHKTIIVGYSNGANIGLNLLLHHPELINKAILFRPLYPLDIDSNSSLEHLNLALLFGQLDPIAANSLQPKLVESLERLHAQVSVSEVEAGHELTHQDIDLVRGFIDEIIQP